MSEEPNRSSRTVGIIVILVLVLAGIVCAWYFIMYKPEQEAKEKARLEQIAKEEAEQKAKELAAQNKIKYDQLIIDADAEFGKENWEAARSLYTEASSLFPNEPYPINQLIIVNTKLEEMARRTAGFVETIPSLTGRFYVIISSSIDDDLAMDYAKKLAKEGTGVKIIEHNYNELPFYGVSISDYDTWEHAEAALTSFSQYSNEAWVLKY